MIVAIVVSLIVLGVGVIVVGLWYRLAMRKINDQTLRSIKRWTQ